MVYYKYLIQKFTNNLILSLIRIAIRMRNLQKLFFFILAFICVFDGADLLFGIKTPLFVLIILLYVISIYVKKDSTVPLNLVIYLILFSFVFPIISLIISYYSTKGNDGMLYIKAYLFLLIFFVMYHYQISILKYLIIMLTILSGIILIIYLITLIPNLNKFTGELYRFGNKYAIFTIHSRQFGEMEVPSIYFHNSPLLIVPLGYYSKKLIESISFKNLLLGIIVFLSLLLSGTRNNMFMCILVPVVIYLFYGKRRNVFVITILILFAFIGLIWIYGETLRGFFSLQEESNSVKMTYLNDYFLRFKNPKTLLIGDGLGSFFYSTPRGEMVSNSELTYLELFRRFGIFMGLAYLLLMIYPCLQITNKSEFAWLYLVYFCFLIMVFFNPFYFSSTGMIFLSEVLYRKETERLK